MIRWVREFKQLVFFKNSEHTYENIEEEEEEEEHESMI
jgi:hypothetical protein